MMNRKTIPLLDRNFGSNDSYLAELNLRAHEIDSDYMASSAIARWLN